MNFDTKVFITAIKAGIQYIPFTLRFVVIIYICSMVLGFLIATVRHFKVPVLSQLLGVFVTFYIGLPQMVALLLYYMLYLLTFDDVAAALHLSITIADFTPLVVCYVAMILSGMCGQCEVFRSAYKSIDQIQFEAGYSIGLTKGQTLRRIIIPQMIPVVIPSMINRLVGAIKNANAVSYIGVYEIMQGSLQACMKSYSYLEGYCAAAVIYWMINLVVEQAGKQVEKRSVRFRRQVA